ncbi:hypothetical protein DNH61_25675 [Paenibacillus sambharensis]|uniref:Peptidase C39-like domain-containing protein n=1 Tax=Paenibacillus sambharensis TaxID=1803190 RepID=A0A2W1L3Z9_9BACL|nr:C39 family peptidase [Paenibacillus sambharensis]PZD92890.1 hypothetical protein DNH61_25675 [Paenibacillus sambharensis]
MKKVAGFILSACLLLFGTPVSAVPVESVSEVIEVGTAIQVSTQYLEEIIVPHFETSWKDAIVGNPTLFYDHDDNPAVYELQIRKGNKLLGYIIAGANTNLNPVVKVGVGLPPTKELTAIGQELETKHNKKVKKATYLYGGPYALGVAIETMDGVHEKYDLLSKQKVSDFPRLSINPGNKMKTREEWVKAKSKLNTKTKQEPIFTTMVYNTDTISGMRSYDQAKSNNNSTGCGPAAGANVLNYYDERGYDKLQSNTDRTDGVALMNHLFSDMGTSAIGTSAEGWANGIKKHANSENGYRFSTTVNYYDSSIDSYFWSQIKSFINNDRPFGVFYPLGGSPYSWHIVTVVGFYEDIDSSYRTITVNTWGRTEYVNWWGGQPRQIMWVTANS